MINYELALWTHTNKFIRLLRGSEEFNGQAYNVIYKINIDGTENLSFSIPLKYFNFEIGDFIENPPISLISEEQKICLILNKKETNENKHDFVVKSYVELHDNNSTIMSVECKGYGNYELDKIGYSLVITEKGESGILTSLVEPNTPTKNTIWINGRIFKKYNGYQWVTIPDLYDGGMPL